MCVCECLCACAYVCACVCVSVCMCVCQCFEDQLPDIMVVTCPSQGSEKGAYWLVTLIQYTVAYKPHMVIYDSARHFIARYPGQLMRCFIKRGKTSLYEVSLTII